VGEPIRRDDQESRLAPRSRRARWPRRRVEVTSDRKLLLGVLRTFPEVRSFLGIVFVTKINSDIDEELDTTDCAVRVLHAMQEHGFAVQQMLVVDTSTRVHGAVLDNDLQLGHDGPNDGEESCAVISGGEGRVRQGGDDCYDALGGRLQSECAAAAHMRATPSIVVAGFRQASYVPLFAANRRYTCNARGVEP
jgi:hypothetical protein